MQAPGGLRGDHIFLDEASVMATENTVMAAVLTPGETVIGNAACEPHVQDLCRFLVSLGAQIEGIESNVLRIHGVDSLGGGEWRIAPDHIEVGSLIGLAAMTSSDITIEDTEPEDLVSILPALRAARREGRDRRHHRPRPAAAAAGRRGRPRRSHPEDRGRPLAGVPRRPDLHRRSRWRRRRSARC